MDLNLIKQRLDSLQKQSTNSGGSGTSLFFKPSVGKQVVRVLPSKFSKEIPFTELKVDFFLHKEKLDIPQGLLVETKVAQTTEADIDKWMNGIPKNTILINGERPKKTDMM